MKPIRQAKKRKIELYPVDIEILSQLKKSNEDLTSHDDEEYSFGRSVALTLKRLEVKQQRLECSNYFMTLSFNDHNRNDNLTHC